MDNITLNNGSMVTVGSFDDIIEVIQENLSYDLGYKIIEYFTDIEYDKEDYKEENDYLNEVLSKTKRMVGSLVKKYNVNETVNKKDVIYDMLEIEEFLQNW